MKYILTSKKILNNKFLRADRKTETVFSLTDFTKVRAVFMRYIKEILILSTQNTRVANRVNHIVKFLDLIEKTFKNHGASYTVKWLKANHTAIQRFSAGQPYKTLREIEPDLPLTRLINGLPGFIGSMDRKEIRLGNTNVIRMWLSILGFYRVLDAPLNPKINTITDPFTGDASVVKSFMHWFYSYSCDKVPNSILKRGINLDCLKADHLRLSPMAGPNGPAHLSVYTDALGVFRYRAVTEAIRKYCSVTSSALWDLLVKTQEIAYNLHRSNDDSQLRLPKVITDWDFVGSPGKEKWKPYYERGQFYDIEIGKLVGLPEPAGKLRVIALVDVWTQSLFKPLHDTIFRILRRIPNDGTFNQDASVMRSAAKAADSGVAYSVDLSSATDRLPIQLQEIILNCIFGSQIGTLWRDILRRPFTMRQHITKDFYDGQHFWYETGQPMGCLSSWAMLALTHHCILQYCARNTTNGPNWSECYEILGDDLVIFDTEVYNQYISFMKALDVGTNPSKSLVSEVSQTFEFAKRTVIKGIDVSGLSWKQFITSRGIKGNVSLSLILGIKGLLFRDGLLLRVLNRSQKWNNKKTRNTEVLQGQLLSLLSHYASKGIITYVDAMSYTQDPYKNKGVKQTGVFGLPLRHTVHDLVTLIKYYNTKLVNTIDPSSDDPTIDADFTAPILSLNKKEERVNLVIRNNVSRGYTNHMFRATLDKLIKFEVSRKAIVETLANQLLTDSPYFGPHLVDNVPMLNKHNTLLAESLLYKGRKPVDLMSKMLRFELDSVIDESPNSVEPFQELFEECEREFTKNSWVLTGLKRSEIPDSIKSWLQIDLENSRLDGHEYTNNVHSFGRNTDLMKTKRFIALNPVSKKDLEYFGDMRTPIMVIDLPHNFFFSHVLKLDPSDSRQNAGLNDSFWPSKRGAYTTQILEEGVLKYVKSRVQDDRFVDEDELKQAIVVRVIQEIYILLISTISASLVYLFLFTDLGSVVDLKAINAVKELLDYFNVGR